MGFSYDDSWEYFESILESRADIQSSWTKLIDYHSSIVDRPYWNDLRQLDVRVEQVEIKEWLEQLVDSSPLPVHVIALWFGITQLWDEEENSEVYAIYLNGSENYDLEDIDWACDCEYDPENKYIIPEVLIELEKIIKTDEENYSFLSWIMPLAYCSFVLDEIIRTRLNKTLFLKNQPKIFVATGFDSGDYINLSTIEK